VRKAVLFDGVTKSSDHVILSKNISKSTGSVFSGKNLIAHGAIVVRNEGLSVLSLGNTLKATMSFEKERDYQRCRARIEALCEGSDDQIAKMASIVGVLHNEMNDFFWTGFYRVVEGRLVIGPYQGTVGCLSIEIGKGVCGKAAARGKTQVVEDVHDFPGHIACDERSKSEIVVPVTDESGALIAILDVDSLEKGAFDEIDRECLEGIVAHIFGGR
jgi:L-methionine (R)-S-oxide reductase